MVKRLLKLNLEKLLLDNDKIPYSKFKLLLSEQKSTGKNLIRLILEKNLMSYEEISSIIESYFGIKHVDIKNIKSLDKSLAKYVPEIWAKKYGSVPIRIDGSSITLAMSDPLNTAAINEIKFTSGYDIVPVMAPYQDIEYLICKIYNSTAKIEISESSFKNMSFAGDNPELEAVTNAPAVGLVNSIILQAVKSGASDIHIEPFESYIRVRLRIDGLLQEIMRLSKESHPEVISRIKIIANLDIAEKRMPKDGRVVINVDGKPVDLRLSIVPTIFGEKVVIRLLNRADFLKSKSELGFDSKDLKKIESMIRLPHGVILITGPTGSGKSTTLYAFLNELNTLEKNIITIEDPVEYTMQGINQINVNTKIGLTFAEGLRCILRQDPDVIMIGEIRDKETARIAISAAITGHLVLSTLHTNDAPSSPDRLIDMGIQPFLVSSSLIGVIAQRLVRKICSFCKYQYEANEYEKKLLGLNSSSIIKLYRGRGCEKCNYTGYRSQIAVYEIMEFTQEHKRSIIQNGCGCEIKDISLKNGMKTLMESCTDLVINGVTTVDELIRKTLMS